MKFGDFRRNFRQLGARSACWVLPGESLPSSGGGGGEPWVPCPHGGLAFSYAEDPQQKHARDKIFEVTGGSVSAGDHASFGEHGGWVRVYPIELRPTLTDLSGKQPHDYSLHLGLHSSTIIGKSASNHPADRHGRRQLLPAGGARRLAPGLRRLALGRRHQRLCLSLRRGTKF